MVKKSVKSKRLPAPNHFPLLKIPSVSAWRHAYITYCTFALIKTSFARSPDGVTFFTFSDSHKSPIDMGQVAAPQNSSEKELDAVTKMASSNAKKE